MANPSFAFGHFLGLFFQNIFVSVVGRIRRCEARGYGGPTYLLPVALLPVSSKTDLYSSVGCYEPGVTRLKLRNRKRVGRGLSETCFRSSLVLRDPQNKVKAGWK